MLDIELAVDLAVARLMRFKRWHDKRCGGRHGWENHYATGYSCCSDRYMREMKKDIVKLNAAWIACGGAPEEIP